MNHRELDSIIGSEFSKEILCYWGFTATLEVKSKETLAQQNFARKAGFLNLSIFMNQTFTQTHIWVNLWITWKFSFLILKFGTSLNKFFSGNHVLYLQVSTWMEKSLKKRHMGAEGGFLYTTMEFHRSIFHFFNTIMELLNITMELLDITMEFEEHTTRFIPTTRTTNEETRRIFIWMARSTIHDIRKKCFNIVGIGRIINCLCIFFSH